MCDTYKVQVEAETDDSRKAQLPGEWELHKRKAERAYQHLKEEVDLSRSSADIELMTFDLEMSTKASVDHQCHLLQAPVVDFQLGYIITV